MIGVFVASLIAIRSTDNPVVMDRLILGWIVTMSLAIVFVQTTRPAAYIYDLVVVVVCVLLSDLAVPARLPVQAFSAWTLTIATTTVSVTFKDPVDSAAIVVLAVVCVMAHVGGVMTSRLRHHSIRNQYEAWTREAALRRALEASAAEVHRLEGILPICATCKKIRDVDGIWQPVDVYVRDHSEAQFSHGFCDECVSQYE